MRVAMGRLGATRAPAQAVPTLTEQRTCQALASVQLPDRCWPSAQPLTRRRKTVVRTRNSGAVPRAVRAIELSCLCCARSRVLRRVRSRERKPGRLPRPNGLGKKRRSHRVRSSSRVAPLTSRDEAAVRGRKRRLTPIHRQRTNRPLESSLRSISPLPISPLALLQPNRFPPRRLPACAASQRTNPRRTYAASPAQIPSPSRHHPSSCRR